MYDGAEEEPVADQQAVADSRPISQEDAWVGACLGNRLFQFVGILQGLMFTD